MKGMVKIMIYITGDTHTDWVSRLNPAAFPEGEGLNRSDYVIVCGDFGIWHDTPEERFNYPPLIDA